MTNHFDKAAKDWDKNLIHAQRTEAIANELKILIKDSPAKTALEFGAGTALLSIVMKDYFQDITLMDSSIEMTNVSVEKLASLDVHHIHPLFFDLATNDYTAKTFDIIYTQMAMHHIDDVENMIIKLYKLLNKGGIIAIADLYKEDGSFHDSDFKGHHGFNPDELSNLLSKHGFMEVKYNQCYEIERLEGSNKKFPIFFMSAVK